MWTPFALFLRSVFSLWPLPSESNTAPFFFSYGASARFLVIAFPYGASRSHLDTQHSVGLPWTSDRPHAETSSWQLSTLTRDGHPFPSRNSNSQSQQANGLRWRGHWNRRSHYCCRNTVPIPRTDKCSIALTLDEAIRHATVSADF